MRREVRDQGSGSLEVRAGRSEGRGLSSASVERVLTRQPATLRAGGERGRARGKGSVGSESSGVTAEPEPA